MKLVAEYLEKAIEFEGMAAQEKDAKLEADPKKAGGGLSPALAGASASAWSRSVSGRRVLSALATARESSEDE